MTGVKKLAKKYKTNIPQYGPNKLVPKSIYCNGSFEILLIN